MVKSETRRMDACELSYNIDWNSSIHDWSQIELVFDYEIQKNHLSNTIKNSSHLPKQLKKLSQFEIDFYFYTPKSLNISSKNFTKDKFYQQLKNLVRLHTPEFKNQHKCYLPLTQKYLGQGIHVANRLHFKNASIYEMKNFANFINQKIKFLKYYKKNTKKYFEQITVIEKIINLFRSNFVLPIRYNKYLIDEDFKKTIFLIDEFISNRILNTYLNTLKSEDKDFHQKIKNENLYRYNHFKRFNLIDSSIDREKYYFHDSQLKKFVSESLFLNLTPIKKDFYYKNIFAGISAALAALVANLARFETNLSQGTEDYGIKFIFMLMLAVIVYVFKDRIKDLSKEYFNNKFKGKLPDLETKVKYNLFDEEGNQKDIDIGSYTETIRYLKENHVPRPIQYLRKKGQEKMSLDLSNENILHYNKKFQVLPTTLSHLNLKKISFKDIFRFNVNNFLAGLDNPEKDAMIFNEEEGEKTIQAPKVYYFNILLEISYLDHGKKNISLEALQLAINKKGIVRIEKTFDKNYFSFQEDIL